VNVQHPVDELHVDDKDKRFFPRHQTHRERIDVAVVLDIVEVSDVSGSDHEQKADQEHYHDYLLPAVEDESVLYLDVG